MSEVNGQSQRDSDGRFAPGSAGGPGRKPGKCRTQELRRAMQDAIEPGELTEIMRTLDRLIDEGWVMMGGLGLPLTGDSFYGGASGTMYLEHALLRYVDCASKEMRVAFWKQNPTRERIARNVWEHLEREAAKHLGD